MTPILNLLQLGLVLNEIEKFECRKTRKTDLLALVHTHKRHIYTWIRTKEVYCFSIPASTDTALNFYKLPIFLSRVMVSNHST